MKIRLARFDDIDAVNALTARAIRSLHQGHYSQAVIESAVRHAYGVDWQLVRDGSYFVAEVAGRLAAAGGWSRRSVIAGAHGPNDIPGELLDPGCDAARIRAFYVDPSFTRQGLATALLEASEGAARDAGFSWGQLTSTIPAVAFYAAHGYKKTGPYSLPLPDGLSLELISMEKNWGG